MLGHGTRPKERRQKPPSPITEDGNTEEYGREGRGAQVRIDGTGSRWTCWRGRAVFAGREPIREYAKRVDLVAVVYVTLLG